MRRRSHTFCALMLSASACTHTAPVSGDCSQASAVDVLHHEVALVLALEPASLSGTGTLRVRARRATRVIVLDALRLQVLSVADAHQPLPFSQADARLCVRLPQPLAAGAELALRLAWRVPSDATVPRFAADQVWAGYQTDAWLPTRQDPAQRATLALQLTAPAELQVIASGRELPQRTAANGARIHSFTLDRPAPPFLYAFAAGHFAQATLQVDGTTLRALGPQGADLAGALAVSAPMLRFLQQHTAL
jgi:aminopeptidase N